MDFSYTKAQLTQKEQIISFIQTVINPLLSPDPEPENFSRDVWRKCAEAGWLEFGMPDDYVRKRGANGSTSCLDQVMAFESIGYACNDNGLPFALSAQGSTVQQTLLQHGSPDQIARYLPGCIAGELIGAHAMTEQDAGSDPSGMRMTATKTDEGYLLNGEKLMISLAPVADFFVLFASINIQAGRWGITAFIVDSQASGVTTSPPVKKLGLDSTPMGRITLEDVVVNEANRLGPEGAGSAIAQHSLEIERCCILASQVGRMEKQLEEALKHTRERKQFGQAVGEFQSVSNRLADMRLRLENARLLLYKTAWQRDQGQSTILESSMLKLLISEHFLASSMDSLRIHGGYSYIDNHKAGTDTRDALGGILYAGTSDIQRNIIAGMLGL